MRKHLAATALLGLLFGTALTHTAGAQEGVVKGTTSGFVTTADGVRIHYLEAGRQGSEQKTPTLLFIPGWTMPGWIWEKQIEHFAKITRVMAMDPRSQGESTKTTEGLYPDARARDIKAVVDQLHLAPVVLVGWSMGVTEIASYVDQFGSDSLAGIVLVDGSASFDDQLALNILKFAGTLMKERRKYTEAFVRNMYKKPQSEEYIQRLVSAALETPTADAMALFVGAFSTDNRPALSKFGRPTLLVVTKSPFDSMYFDMQKRIPGARLEQFEDAGHALFVDDAERFNALVEQFVKSLPPTGKP
jgi:microsomal epoxide hydrolase